MHTSTEFRDEITDAPLRALAATLPAGLVEHGRAIPPLAHWLYFLNPAAREQIGQDGHPVRSATLPGAELPRRMWAGSVISFRRPILRNSAVTRTSITTSVQEKTGRSGRLAFVQVEHVVSDERGVFLTERQDIVYREPAGQQSSAPAPTPAPSDPQWRRAIHADAVMLFRYSAVTFNSHRIHFDRTYAIEQEGYAGLVVQAPLLATLLLYELIHRHPDRTVTEFQFRAIRPVTDVATFDVCGSVLSDDTAELFVADAVGALCMTANATFGGSEKP